MTARFTGSLLSICRSFRLRPSAQSPSDGSAAGALRGARLRLLRPRGRTDLIPDGEYYDVNPCSRAHHGILEGGPQDAVSRAASWSGRSSPTKRPSSRLKPISSGATTSVLTPRFVRPATKWDQSSARYDKRSTKKTKKKAARAQATSFRRRRIACAQGDLLHRGVYGGRARSTAACIHPVTWANSNSTSRFYGITPAHPPSPARLQPQEAARCLRTGGIALGVDPQP